MQLRFSKKNRIKRERIFLAETENPRKRRSEQLWRLAAGELIVLGFSGIISCFLFEGAGIWLYLAAAAYFAAMVMLDAGRSALKTAIFVLPIAVCVLVSPSGFYEGFLHFANQCITVFNSRFHSFAALLTTAGASNTNVLQFDAALMAAIVWLVYVSIRADGMIQSVALCLAAFAVIGLGGLNVSMALCALLALGLTLVWLQKAAGYASVTKTAIYLLPACAILAVIALVVNANSEDATLNAMTMREQIVTAADEFRYGSDTLPQGDMTEASEMGRGSEEALRVTFSDETEELYLRGFVGGDFDGSAWAEPERGNYYGDNDGIIRWLSENGLEQPFQYGSYYSYTDSGQAAQRETIQVENIGAYRKYVYLPYQSLSLVSGGGRLNFDMQMEATGFFGAGSYTVSTINTPSLQQNITREDLNADMEGAAAFSQAEEIYRGFVNDTYLTVSEEEAAVIKSRFFNDMDWSAANLSALTTQVRIVLQENTAYSRVPTGYNGSEDFLQWFLSGDKTGNSAYYATVAVLAYRCAGIPARYVEGYYLEPAAAAALKGNGEQTAALTGTAEHSWVEIYMDGIGWLPIEVAPGFYNAQYSLSQVLGQPQSSVNIVDNEDQNQLQGSTADSLPENSGRGDTAETTVRRVVHFLGIALLLAIALWLLCTGVKLQARLRQSVREKKIRAAAPEAAIRLMFREICRIIRAAGFPYSESRPYEAEKLFETEFPDVEPEEYLRVVQIVQGAVFGEIAPKPDELCSVQRFIAQLSRSAYGQSSPMRRLIMRRVYACCL